MIKKFINNYAAYIVIIAFITIIFAFGFMVGKYGIKSADSVEQAENYKQYTATATSGEDVTSAQKIEEEPVLIDLGEFEITAYCTCSKCCGKSDGITATGTQATAGRTVAVDPQVIPYGTQLIINGHTYIAEDTGGAINGNKIDICFETHEEALNYGVQYANVYTQR